MSKDGHLYIDKNTDNCNECGLCIKVCPIINNYSYEAKDKHSKPYAAWANDDKIRLKSASGGIFSALAYRVIEEGGCVFGACMEGLNVKHILIEDKKDIHKIQGSKYRQGDCSEAYQKVKQLLKQKRKVLFSGAGCQMTGLYLFLGEKFDISLLITVDFICSGFPSLLPLKKEINYHRKNITTLTYTNKELGWKQSRSIKLKTIDGNVISNKWREDLISCAFTSALLHRKSCLNCKFAYAKRKSNITVGDFWGDTEYIEEHYKGLSIVIIHDHKGYKILNDSNITFYETTWSKFLPNNYRMIYGKFRIAKLHPYYYLKVYLFKKYDYCNLLKKFQSPWAKIFPGSLFWRLLIYIFYTYPMRKAVRDTIAKNDIQ